MPAHTAAQAAAAAIAARINEAVAALQQKIEPPEPKIFSEGQIKMIPCGVFLCGVHNSPHRADVPWQQM
jgi:hypothetical protein